MYCNPASTLLANHLTPKSRFPLLHLPGGMHLPISQCCCARQMNLFTSLKFFFSEILPSCGSKFKRYEMYVSFTSTAQPLLFLPRLTSFLSVLPEIFYSYISKFFYVGL